MYELNICNKLILSKSNALSLSLFLCLFFSVLNFFSFFLFSCLFSVSFSPSQMEFSFCLKKLFSFFLFLLLFLSFFLYFSFFFFLLLSFLSFLFSLSFFLLLSFFLSPSLFLSFSFSLSFFLLLSFFLSPSLFLSFSFSLSFFLLLSFFLSPSLFLSHYNGFQHNWYFGKVVYLVNGSNGPKSPLYYRYYHRLIYFLNNFYHFQILLKDRVGFLMKSYWSIDAFHRLKIS
ncbi:unnamed protein product [Acanthosepion pharaonis]|uniref:Uncharacterized protein n=1 Tax=Acanthosepion pharaonis TaxID=158019 RepID=A0A812DCB6_ACAPH|nr:unnamed protein product [Sepia pharaonis]